MSSDTKKRILIITAFLFIGLLLSFMASQFTNHNKVVIDSSKENFLAKKIDSILTVNSYLKAKTDSLDKVNIELANRVPGIIIKYRTIYEKIDTSDAATLVHDFKGVFAKNNISK